MEHDSMVIGVDAHKRTHTMVATDAVGRRLAETTVEATSDGHLEALEWASRWPVRRWAVEDCRHLTHDAGEGPPTCRRTARAGTDQDDVGCQARRS